MHPFKISLQELAAQAKQALMFIAGCFVHSSSGQLGEAGNTDEGNLKTIEGLHLVSKDVNKSRSHSLL